MAKIRTTALVAWLLALAAATQAQVAEKKTLTLEGARKAIGAAVAKARELSAPGGVIAIVDDGGNLMALERLDGTFAAGANISVGKARTSALFKRPTRVFEEIIGKGRYSMTALKDFTPLQGGVPITLDGQIVGAIGVSGAASAAQDEELALAGAAAFEGTPAAAAAVTYIPKDKVAAAFAKGMPMLELENYKIHASRREKSGLVEIHGKDTDIMYVLTGTATLVTGGTVADAKTVEPDEVRGATIQGGETRKIVPGDVVVIPRSVPHWFREVPGPLTYYVVKVR